MAEQWDGLDDPITSTGVIAREQVDVLPVHIPVPETGPHPPVHIPVPDTGPHPSVHPLNQLPAIPQSAPGPVQQLPRPPTAPDLNEQIARAVTKAFSLEKDQVRALKAAKEVDDENTDNGRKRIVGWIISGVLGVGSVGGGGWYMTHESHEGDVGHTEAVRRHSVDTRLGTVEVKQRLIQSDLDGVETDLDAHMLDQSKENEADKLRSLRQEMMLEQLLRLRGRTPPKKAESLRDPERAVGIDPDNPFADEG